MGESNNRWREKSNGGFSLVELIVVIAIMAVLVGVLAPAYIRYVEKSRKSSDIVAIEQVITAAEDVSTDLEYQVPEGAVFSLVTTNGLVSFRITKWGSETDKAATKDANWQRAEDEWNDTSNKGDPYQFVSRSWRAESGTIHGEVQKDGTLRWYYDNTNAKVFKDMVEYSPDFGDRFK